MQILRVVAERFSQGGTQDPAGFLAGSEIEYFVEAHPFAKQSEEKIEALRRLRSRQFRDHARNDFGAEGANPLLGVAVGIRAARAIEDFERALERVVVIGLGGRLRHQGQHIRYRRIAGLAVHPFHS